MPLATPSWLWVLAVLACLTCPPVEALSHEINPSGRDRDTISEDETKAMNQASGEPIEPKERQDHLHDFTDVSNPLDFSDADYTRSSNYGRTPYRAETTKLPATLQLTPHPNDQINLRNVHKRKNDKKMQFPRKFKYDPGLSLMGLGKKSVYNPGFKYMGLGKRTVGFNMNVDEKDKGSLDVDGSPNRFVRGLQESSYHGSSYPFNGLSFDYTRNDCENMDSLGFFPNNPVRLVIDEFSPTFFSNYNYRNPSTDISPIPSYAFHTYPKMSPSVPPRTYYPQISMIDQNEHSSQFSHQADDTNPIQSPFAKRDTNPRLSRFGQKIQSQLANIKRSLQCKHLRNMQRIQDFGKRLVNPLRFWSRHEFYRIPPYYPEFAVPGYDPFQAYSDYYEIPNPARDDFQSKMDTVIPEPETNSPPSTSLTTPVSGIKDSKDRNSVSAPRNKNPRKNGQRPNSSSRLSALDFKRASLQSFLSLSESKNDSTFDRERKLLKELNAKSEAGKRNHKYDPALMYMGLGKRSAEPFPVESGMSSPDESELKIKKRSSKYDPALTYMGLGKRNIFPSRKRNPKYDPGHMYMGLGKRVGSSFIQQSQFFSPGDKNDKTSMRKLNQFDADFSRSDSAEDSDAASDPLDSYRDYSQITPSVSHSDESKNIGNGKDLLASEMPDLKRAKRDLPDTFPEDLFNPDQDIAPEKRDSDGRPKYDPGWVFIGLGKRMPLVNAEALLDKFQSSNPPQIVKEFKSYQGNGVKKLLYQLSSFEPTHQRHVRHRGQIYSQPLSSNPYIPTYE